LFFYVRLGDAFAKLIGDGAGCFARRLTRRLAFAATAAFDRIGQASGM
jgi:hypothetical protein